MHKVVVYILTSLILCSALGWEIVPAVLEGQEGEAFEKTLLIRPTAVELPFEPDLTHHFEPTLEYQTHPDRKVCLLDKPLLI